MSLNTEAVQQWASDWADQFDQTVTEETLKSYVGKLVTGSSEIDEDGNGRGFKEATLIAGYSFDHLFFQTEEDSEMSVVNRASLITADGKQFPLFAGMVIAEAE